MRRLSSALTRSAASGSPAGIPSRIATRPRPCDSPAVVKRNVTLGLLPQTSTILHQPPPSSPTLPIIAREPDSGSGSRACRTPFPLATGSPPPGRGREDVIDGRQPHDDQTARRNPEQQLGTTRILSDPQ